MEAPLPFATTESHDVPPAASDVPALLNDNRLVIRDVPVEAVEDYRRWRYSMRTAFMYAAADPEAVRAFARAAGDATAVAQGIARTCTAG